MLGDRMGELVAKGGFVLHIHEEKLEEVRQLADLVQGPLDSGYARIMQEIGVRSEEVWLASTSEGAFLVVMLEGDDPEASLRAFLTLEDPPVGIWLRQVAADATDIDTAHLRPLENIMMQSFQQSERANE